MAAELTKDQRAAVYADGSVLVSAAAGSGKTSVLSARALRLMTDEASPADADRLLIVTFTNAAAGEMKERISRSLRDALKKDPQNALLKKQRALLSHASVCTIDSFCYDLVKKYFHLLGVSPDVRIIDKGPLELLSRRAVRAVCDRYFAAGDADFLRIFDCLGTDNPEAMYSAVQELQCLLSSLPFADDFEAETLRMYSSDFASSDWAKTLLDAARGELDTAYGLLHGAIDDMQCDEKLMSACCEQYMSAYKSIGGMCRLAEGGKWDELHAALSSFEFEKLGTVRGHNNKAFADAVRSVRAAVLEKVGRAAECISCTLAGAAEDISSSEPQIRKLFEVTRAYKAELDAYKRERGVLDFADIEVLALSLLVEKRDGRAVPTAVAQEISSMYDEVLIDEYQDVNDLQDALLRALSGGGERLFMVGDIKQSIYRFRQANPDIFLRRRGEHAQCADGKKYVTLDKNFRSRRGICGAVNFFFRRLMTKGSAGMEYTGDDMLDSAAPFDENGETDAEIHIIDKRGSKEKSALLEARHIAAYIKEKMAAAPFLKSKDGGLRRAEYGDFAILLRSPSSSADIYMRELKRAGIPVCAETGESFFDAPEIMTVLALLKVIDNPLRDIPLMSALMSPIYGFSADDVANIKLCGKGGSLYESLTAAAEENSAAAAVLKDIDDLRKTALSMPADEFLVYLYARTGYLSLVQAAENGAQKKANLLMLLDMAASYEKSRSHGICAFTRHIISMEEASSDIKCAQISSGRDDAVRIMSIHRSKGLQFPVCIIASCASRFNRTDVTAPLVMHRRYGVGLMCCGAAGDARYKGPAHTAISLELRRDMTAEELRVLYVAMTRAEEKLVLLLTENDASKKAAQISALLQSEFAAPDEPIGAETVLSAGGYGDWIMMCALLHPSGGELRELCSSLLHASPADTPIDISIIDAESIAEPEQRSAEKVSPDENIIAEIKNSLSYEYPHAADCTLPVKLTASELTHDGVSNGFSSRPAFLQNADMTAAERGTALHEFMQYADFSAAEADVSAEIDRLVGQKFISPAQGSSIDREKAAAFFKSDLYRRIKASPDVRREWRFMLDIPAEKIYPGAGSGAATVVQGIVDCFFEEEGSIVIVDYKTDRVKSGRELAERYRSQIMLYSYALSRLLGKKVSECLLYSLELGEAIKID